MGYATTKKGRSATTNAREYGLAIGLLAGLLLPPPAKACPASDHTFNANNRAQRLCVGGTDAGTASNVYNAMNQLTAMTKPTGEAVSYTYDANGNRLTRTENGVMTDKYAWDVDNRLISVAKSGNQRWDYRYDYRTRRHRITEGTWKTGSVFIS